MEQEFKPKPGEEIEARVSPSGVWCKLRFIGRQLCGRYLCEDTGTASVWVADEIRPIQQEKPADKTPREQFEDRFGKGVWGLKVGGVYYTALMSGGYLVGYKNFVDPDDRKLVEDYEFFLKTKEPIKRLVRVSPAIGITKNGPTVLSPHAVESRHAASTWFNLNGLCVDEIQ